MDWKREIVIAHMVKQKLSESDVDGLWAHHFPEVAATEDSIIDAEKHIGARFSDSHREFLKHADGWRSFYQAVDILNTSEFEGGARFKRAILLLNSLEDLKDLCGFDKSELLPIAVSTNDIDVFAISNDSSSEPGVVFWFAGQLIDRFANFSEWFLSMVDYNRMEYDRLTNELNK